MLKAKKNRKQQLLITAWCRNNISITTPNHVFTEKIILSWDIAVTMSRKLRLLMMGQIQAVNGQKSPLKTHHIFHHYSRIISKQFECVAKEKNHVKRDNVINRTSKNWVTVGTRTWLIRGHVQHNQQSCTTPLGILQGCVKSWRQKTSQMPSTWSWHQHGHHINMCTNVRFYEDLYWFLREERDGTKQMGQTQISQKMSHNTHLLSTTALETSQGGGREE
jgi:hypothetical protein